MIEGFGRTKFRALALPVPVRLDVSTHRAIHLPEQFGLDAKPFGLHVIKLFALALT
jgi:hypothetical protein